MSQPVEPFTIEQFYKFMQQGKLWLVCAKNAKKSTCHPAHSVTNAARSSSVGLTFQAKANSLTYTVINVAPQQFQNLTPYAVGIVELAGGLRIPGMIQGVTQEQLKIGMDLVVDFGTCSQPQQWPSWQRYCFKPL